MKRRDFVAGGLALPALTLGMPNVVDTSAGNAKEPATPSSSAASVKGKSTGSSSDERFDRLCALVERRMAELKIPGVAFGVRKDGVLQMKGLGISNVEDPEPITEQTIFPLASISKTMTATAVMKLVDQGKIELAAPVQRYLPQWRVQEEAMSREVTIAHLLTHTPGWEGQLTPEDHGDASLAYFADVTMKTLPFLAPPGSVWSYNNAGFALAGRVIEVVTGQNIHTALLELIFAPYGLTRSFTRMGDIVTHRFAQGHRPAGDRTEVVRPFVLGSSVTAGGVAMSLVDLMSYAQFHMGEATERARLLSETSRYSMQSPWFKKAPTDDEMGLGWHLRRVNGVQTVVGGGTAGAQHRLLLELVPSQRLAFAILTNHADGWRLVQDVERATLAEYGVGKLAANQPIVHRGINEDMTAHATPLARQPDLAEYVGTYVRTPGATSQVRVQNSVLTIGGGDGVGTPLTFYAKDAAFVSSGGSLGTPYEFVRGSDGRVGWVRINGRVAKRQLDVQPGGS